MLTCYKAGIKIGNEFLFRNISFTLMPGSCVYLNGKNGSGKTSLLRSIAGVRDIDEGEILFQTLESNLRFIKRDINQNLSNNYPIINYIAHDIGVELDFSVNDNLKFWSRYFNSQKAYEAVIEFFNLKNIIHEKLHNLSRGTQKRVAIARLMLIPSSVWILDEIEVNMDSEALSMLYNCIITKLGTGGIIIISSSKKINAFNFYRIDMDAFKIR